MMRTIPLDPQASWVQLCSTQDDWDAMDPAILDTMLVRLSLIRAFEESVLDLAGNGLVHGPAHSSIGQEGGAVGSILPLLPGDQVNGSHRGHHQFLAKALGYVAQQQPLARDAPFDGAIRETLQGALAEIMGLRNGFCLGRGGSMHLRWAEAGVTGTNAIVGGGVPLAAGAAWADRMAGTDNVSVTYFGDGAVNIGSVLETMNLAAAWKLPLVFFIENNLYAVSTHVDEATAEPRLSSRGLAFGIPSWQVDGMDPVATYMAMQQALSVCRTGQGPAVIEATVYRYFHQNGKLPGSAFGYRDKGEEAAWRERDPIGQVGREMIRRDLLTAKDISDLRERCRAVMEEISAELTVMEGNRRAVRSDLWPAASFRDVGIRSDLDEISALPRLSQGTAGESTKRKFVDVVADVMNRRMEQDPRIVVLGEDVHRLKGGTNGATRDLAANFPGRVFGTPISENAFMGLAGGLAMDGRFRPVVEFMYPDFMWVAADQVFNQVGKARHMFGGAIDVPLVLRTKVAMGTGYGSQHSMDPAGIFATAPGWRIVAPSCPADYVGLMNAALAINDPVLVIEHVDLYQQMLPAPIDLDGIIPPGSAALRRSGSKVTVITYLAMVQPVLDIVDELDADVDVIDLRWLDRASLDWDMIGESIRRTNRVLLVEQGARGTSYGGWLADEIQRRLFDWLDGPIMRVTGGEASPSISKVLERAACAGREEISAALGELLELA
ncbi:thiamine pyrophosphate-dependent enzyme [Acetobacter cerevisiae]|uniref:2-oxoglutarate dehydrogenase E1 component n=1 Tax=Acetobacter cerevisiae TaxID=178900 RepID=A0ABT1EUP7_9PROT|nr:MULTISPECIES: alpha-ketoacid dehydrogenase subunit alpha/beta [Acetobacter]MCG4255156.1 MFS transporter [Acetobacter senegalensis]MCP1247093.1 thiamine pyrophosphate-dependent enzyme [Acetobacter cerevisiae]MCP1256646.1 thiamine pyrophosphate-dependent enzyme [Acetobacter cerevisiae]